MSVISSPTDFRDLLRDVWMQVEHSRQPLSVVAFWIPANHPQRDTVARAIAADEASQQKNVGWVQKHQIGIVLPNCDAQQARDIAARIVETLGMLSSGVVPHIYAYPTCDDGFAGSDRAGTWCADDGDTANRRDAADDTAFDSSAQLALATEPADVSEIQPLEPLLFRPTPLWKRCLDVTAAVLLLTLLMPLFVVVAIIIKLGCPGPVFFKQWRVGSRGDLFGIWKFRTMHVDTDTNRHQRHVASLMNSAQPVRKLQHTSQLIPFGRLMRSTCIDELPQLFNVLNGDMSLVGPRPDVLSWKDYAPWQRRRFDVVPGMTGLWQVSGKNETTFAEMMQLDIEYVEQRSIGLDLKILFWTVPAIVKNALYHERRDNA